MEQVVRKNCWGRKPESLMFMHCSRLHAILPGVLQAMMSSGVVMHVCNHIMFVSIVICQMAHNLELEAGFGCRIGHKTIRKQMPLKTYITYLDDCLSGFWGHLERPQPHKSIA